LPPSLTPDQRSVISAHKHDTTLYLLAAAPSLRRLADTTAKAIGRPRTTKAGQAYGRPVVRVSDDDPGRFEPTGSWCVAILVDASTDWKPLLQMGRRLGVNGQGRTQFHIGERLDPVTTLEAWTVLSSTPDFAAFADSKNLLKHVLEQLNHQNVRDHAAGSVPGIP